MTLHGLMGAEVGVRELHDKLSSYLERVEAGEEVLVTRRGKPVARLLPPEGATKLDDLVRRGIVRMPTKTKTPKRPTAKLEGPGPTLSDIVIEQRRR